MVLLILNFIFAALFTEAITELVVKSEFFSPVREFFFNRRKKQFFEFIHDVLDCGYCFSVWAAFLTVALFYSKNELIYIFMGCVIIHRLSNVAHYLVDLTRGKR